MSINIKIMIFIIQQKHMNTNQDYKIIFLSPDIARVLDRDREKEDLASEC